MARGVRTRDYDDDLHASSLTVNFTASRSRPRVAIDAIDDIKFRLVRPVSLPDRRSPPWTDGRTDGRNVMSGKRENIRFSNSLETILRDAPSANNRDRGCGQFKKTDS